LTTANFVDFQNVWLAYNDELLAQNHYAVENINLQVKQGEFIAIVGPSGCGKSTFMKLTTGLKRPSKGQIFCRWSARHRSLENQWHGVPSAFLVAMAHHARQRLAAA